MAVTQLVTFTTLYPNAEQPRHGIFVEQRLRHLVATGEVYSRVLAPVPWFPFKHRRFGHYSLYAQVAPQEERYGIEVYHPRYPVIPKVGMLLAPQLLARGAIGSLRRLAQQHSIDLIDAHYFYPDGVAAVHLGQRLQRPVVITARGTDVNLIARIKGPDKMVRWAAQRCSAIITVSQALKGELVALGVDAQKVQVLPNGVDLNLFTPALQRQALRRRLGLAGTTLLSVGNLLESKGHHLVIELLPELPDVSLIIIGKGPMADALKRQAAALNVAERVRFIPYLAQSELAEYYSAADLLVLASASEGMANVWLEAMACGTPVLATAVGGAREVLAVPEAGELVEERSKAGLLQGYRRLMARLPERSQTRRHAETLGWEKTTQGQLALFRSILQAAP